MSSSDYPHLSWAAMRALRYLLSVNEEARTGSEITRDADVSRGTVYPLLWRLEKAGWLSSEDNRYQLTDNGRDKAQAALDRLHMRSS